MLTTLDMFLPSCYCQWQTQNSLFSKSKPLFLCPAKAALSPRWTTCSGANQAAMSLWACASFQAIGWRKWSLSSLACGSPCQSLAWHWPSHQWVRVWVKEVFDWSSQFPTIDRHVNMSHVLHCGRLCLCEVVFWTWGQSDQVRLFRCCILRF